MTCTEQGSISSTADKPSYPHFLPDKSLHSGKQKKGKGRLHSGRHTFSKCLSQFHNTGSSENMPQLPTSHISFNTGQNSNIISQNLEI
jgi:hypothetical protein